MERLHDIMLNEGNGDYCFNNIDSTTLGTLANMKMQNDAAFLMSN